MADGCRMNVTLPSRVLSDEQQWLCCQRLSRICETLIGFEVMGEQELVEVVRAVHSG